MARMIIVAPLPIAAIAASRGSGAVFLASADPKEVWADSAVGSAATISVDLGVLRSIDTVFLGYLYGPAAGAVWTITGGVAGHDEFTIKASGALRVPDVAGKSPSFSHGLWFGAPVSVRFLKLSLTQPGGADPFMAGVLLIGRAFQPQLGREWGSGRRPIDTGTATPLASGGFGIAEGARKLGLSWTFGDLSDAEVDDLEDVALAVGETNPVLVVEDPAATAGLRKRTHYGLFQGLRAFDRRNKVQTRWEFSMEGWV